MVRNLARRVVVMESRSKNFSNNNNDHNKENLKFLEEKNKILPQLSGGGPVVFKKAKWLLAVGLSPKVQEYGDNSNSYLYNYSTREEAENQLALIEHLIGKLSQSGVFVSTSLLPDIEPSFPYCLLVMRQEHDDLFQLKAGDKVVKSLRWDYLCYIKAFIEGITPTPQHRIHQQLRTGKHKKYTVFASGVYSRDKKPSPYPEKNLNKKRELSQHQSTSLITSDAQVPIFGHAKSRSDKLVGVMLDPDDALFNRLFLYDGGTVGRPYEFDSKEEAVSYFKAKTNPNYPTLFQSVEDFKHWIAKDVQRHNEALARIRWNVESSSVAIFSDSFEANCVAQYYSELLLARLKKQYQELDKPWDEDYQIPMTYYLPDHAKHWTAYSEKEKQMDREKAASVFSDINCRYDTIHNQGNGEFLLLLNDPKAVWEEIKYDKIQTLYDLILRGHLQLVVALFERAQLQTSLDEELQDYARQLDTNRLATQLPHSYYGFSFRHTALHLAAEVGMVEVVRFFLLLLPNLNIYCRGDADTALHLATIHGQAEIIKLLLEHDNSGINAEGEGRMTALHLAALFNHEDITQLLLQYDNIDVNAGCCYGSPFEMMAPRGTWSALHIAVLLGHDNVTNVLLVSQYRRQCRQLPWENSS